MANHRIRHCGVVAALGLLSVHALSAPVEAQSNSLFGNRGAATARPNGTSSSSLGGSSFGSTTGGSSGLGSSGFGSNSGFGTSSMGGSGFGTNSARGGMGMGGTGMGMGGNTMSMNQGGFLGANPQGVFIGGGQLGTAGGQNTLGGAGGLRGMNRGGLGNLGMGGRGRNGQQQQQGRNQFGGNIAPNAAVSAFRPQQRIAFEYASPSREQVTTSVRGTISDVASRRPELSGVTVVLDEEGEATLRGTVRTPAARGLAEALVRIEPGVRRVRNELAVAGR